MLLSQRHRETCQQHGNYMIFMQTIFLMEANFGADRFSSRSPFCNKGSGNCSAAMGGDTWSGTCGDKGGWQGSRQPWMPPSRWHTRLNIGLLRLISSPAALPSSSTSLACCSSSCSVLSQTPPPAKPFPPLFSTLSTSSSPGLIIINWKHKVSN